MQSMSISLPEPMKNFGDGQVAACRYSSASNYVRELIHADERRWPADPLQTLLLEGLRGEELPLTRADWQATCRHMPPHHQLLRNSRSFVNTVFASGLSGRSG